MGTYVLEYVSWVRFVNVIMAELLTLLEIVRYMTEGCGQSVYVNDFLKIFFQLEDPLTYSLEKKSSNAAILLPV